jgi:LAO/AO transport system kinase
VRAGFDLQQCIDGVLSGSRSAIGVAITLVESTRDDDREAAEEMLAAFLPRSRDARRIGVTGIPGAGKSTFIDAIGSFLTDLGRSVGVVAVDPSSPKSGGSLLGDKTRMTRLSIDPRSFVRSSGTGGKLGGVARRSQECLVVLAAAGYDVLFVETVGTGQSEVDASEMTDSCLLLSVARTGDQLQGAKRGVLEMVDVVAINKADSGYEADARQAARDLKSALRLFNSSGDGWKTAVVTCSATTGQGIPEIWELLEEHESWLRESGQLEIRRQQQAASWMWSLVRDRVLDRLEDGELKQLTSEIEHGVRAGQVVPSRGAQLVIDALVRNWRTTDGSGEP